MDADGKPSHVILGDAVRPDEAQRFRKGQRPLPVTSHATRVPPRRRDRDRSAAYLAHCRRRARARRAASGDHSVSALWPASQRLDRSPRGRCRTASLMLGTAPAP